MLPQEAGSPEGMDWIGSRLPALPACKCHINPPAPRIVSAFDSYECHVLFNATEVFSGGLNFGSLFLILLAKQSNVLAYPICPGN